MAEEKGFVNKNLEAIIKINLADGDLIDCTIDTGFSGTLLLPSEIVKQSLMMIVGSEEVELIDEISTEVETALGQIIWFSEKKLIRLFVSKTNECLIGTGLLKNSKLEIDYINSKVKITKPQ